MIDSRNVICVQDWQLFPGSPCISSYDWLWQDIKRCYGAKRCDQTVITLHPDTSRQENWYYTLEERQYFANKQTRKHVYVIYRTYHFCFYGGCPRFYHIIVRQPLLHDVVVVSNKLCLVLCNAGHIKHGHLIKWICFLHYLPFVRGIDRSSLHPLTK